MAWKTSRRREQLPGNWKTLRRSILERDGYVCTWMDRGVQCGAEANQVDHIKPGSDHSPENLRALCERHHARKSALEGYAATRKAMLDKKWKNDRRFGHQEEHAGTGESYKHPWQR